MEGSKADAVLIKQTEELGKAKAQQRTLDFATQIGANPDAANAALGKLIEQSNQLLDRKSTRLNSSHSAKSRMPSSA